AANQRHYDDALKFARQATAARRAEIAAATKQNSASDPSGASIAAISQGELAHELRVEAAMALRVGDLASARAAAEESLWIVSEEPGLPLWWRSDTVALMGQINERQGRVVTAEHDLRDARDLDTQVFGNTAPTALSNLRLAEFYTRQQLYGPALDAFRIAFAIAAKIRLRARKSIPMTSSSSLPPIWATAAAPIRRPAMRKFSAPASSRTRALPIRRLHASRRARRLATARFPASSSNCNRPRPSAIVRRSNSPPKSRARTTSGIPIANGL